MSHVDGQLLPAVRPVEIIPREDDGETRFIVVDRLRIADATLAMSAAGYFVMAHLDGRHTIQDVQQSFESQLNVRVEPQAILDLVAALDDACLLQNARFEKAYRDRLADYRAGGVRDNRQRYPDIDTLTAELRDIIASGQPDPGPLTGLIAPHLDYERGGPAYADAYATLAAAPPADRYVILGTNHFGRSTGTVATACDFVTPLGRVTTDTAFIAALEEALGCSLRTYELDHVHEHSVELQVHFLQVIAAGRPFTIVPVLCGYPCGPTGTQPPGGDGPDLAAFSDALATLIRGDSRRTVVIAGADLSHVGQQFGDEEAVTPERLGEVAAEDQALLERVQRGELDLFLKRISASDNATRVCSPGCIYAARRALRDRPCTVLRYHQAVDFAADTHVTCAAAVIG